MEGHATEIALNLWATNHGLVSLEMKRAGPPEIDWPTQHRAVLAALARGYAPGKEHSAGRS